VKLFVENKASLNATDQDGLSPLHATASCTQVDLKDDYLRVAKLLVSKGADINLQMEGNCTALHIAACAGKKGEEMVKYLLENGADPTIESGIGFTALHYSINKEYGSGVSAEMIEKDLKKKYPHFFETFDRNKERKMAPSSAKSRLSEEEKRSVLPGGVNLRAIAERIKNGGSKRIVVLTGAGISVNAGIPDFRSPETGIYSQKRTQEFNASSFDLSSLVENPSGFYRFCKEIFLPSAVGRVKPTITHRFLGILASKGLLQRIYTQNVDTLERKAGIDADLLVESHGTFATGHCIKCRTDADMDKFWKSVDEDNLPLCQRCGSIQRPDVVFFGEALPPKFFDLRTKDMKNADLLIVIGTSLMVYPFAGLVNEVSEDCPRLLVNKKIVGPFTKYHQQNQHENYRDVICEGDCDEGILALVNFLGWENQL